MKSANILKKSSVIFLAMGALFNAPTLQAEFLFDSFLTPSFEGDPNTEFSQWQVLYAPMGGQNYPDADAPHGIYQSASAAGFSNPGDWDPEDPSAFWDVNNPTLTQTNPAFFHFVIGPSFVGNIYSFNMPSFYTLDDATPFTLGTAVFQFQTEGTQVDFSSIRLEYHDGSGLVQLAPDEYIREYRAGSAAFGGFTNRTALQWDLAGLGITSYQIKFNSEGSSMSFQRALLDTSETFAAVVPEGRTWIGTGNQMWSTATNWQDEALSVENGNVRFEQNGSTVITLDGDRVVGEAVFDTPHDVTISGGATLTANTGITTNSGSTGTYTVQTPYELGAFKLMNINAGEVRLEGTVTGGYGLLKTGEGTLVLAGDNTFGTANAGVGVQGGTLRIEGVNTYGGSSSVLWGRLEVAGDALVSTPGALGNATSSILVGASSETFASTPEPAMLVIDGNHIIARNISIEAGSFEKRLGAVNTTSEAVFSGNVNLLGTGPDATSLKLFAEGSQDVVRFSGNISGGAGGSGLRINADAEQGTVIFSGSNMTYSNATVVHGGTLEIANGTSTTGNGDWTVQNGATLQLEGMLAGTGSFTMESGSILRGSGTLNRAFTVGSGVTLAPGNSPGTLNTATQTWADGGIYLWEINNVEGTPGTDPGWDLLNITGTLDITATALDPFIIEITSLTLANTAGAAANFDDFTDYSWLIASATGGISGFDPDVFTIDTSGFQNHFTGTFGIGVTSNELFLHYAAIPEPSTLAFLSVAVAAFLAGRRRRNTRFHF